MITFKLPDLGEGLPEADIVTWHVQEGDSVAVDQPLVSVETAKAVVEVPSPYAGRIVRLHAQPGDTVQTGKPLVDFDLPAQTADTAGQTSAASSQTTGTAAQAGAAQPRHAQGMVVGHMASSDREWVDRAIAGGSRRGPRNRVRAAPAVRMLAKRLHVDLAGCRASGRHGLISVDDVLAAANLGARGPALTSLPGMQDAERLRGLRKAMAASMSLSRDEIAMCTLFDDADIEAWTDRSAITPRLIRAIVAGVKAEPALNAWFDPSGPARKLLPQVDLAVAVDTGEGLIVPVLQDVGARSAEQLRAALADIKERSRARSIAAEEMRNHTFTLSNFGTLAGRYATPLVVPPAVAILGTGKLQRDVVAGASAAEIHVRIPLSLTFDHRCITGGEACRFLAAVIADLIQPA